jgi:TolA-binding protein
MTEGWMKPADSLPWWQKTAQRIQGAEAQYMLGQTYLEEGESERAREAFARVQVLFEAHDTWVAEAQYKIAEIHIREGRRGEALQLLESIIDRFPGNGGRSKSTKITRQKLKNDSKNRSSSTPKG